MLNLLQCRLVELLVLILLTLNLLQIPTTNKGRPCFLFFSHSPYLIFACGRGFPMPKTSVARSSEPVFSIQLRS